MSIPKSEIARQSPTGEGEIITGRRAANGDNDTPTTNVAGTAPRARFSPGDIYITPGAIEALGESDDGAREFLVRHLGGDWGEVGAQDWAQNEFALSRELRILSAYRTGNGTRLWLITEADRSSTTILLPEEY